MADEDNLDDNAQLAKLLDMVSMKASNLTANASQKLDVSKPKTNPNSATPTNDKPSTTQPTSTSSKTIADLPIGTKLQILSFLDTQTQRSVNPLVRDPSELLPTVSFVPNFVSPTPPLKFFSVDNLKRLDNEGFFYFDGFLGSSKSAESIANEIEKMRNVGLLKRSGMSTGEQHWQNNQIRGDLIYWVQDRWKLKDDYPNVYELLTKLDGLRIELNDCCKLQSEKVQTQITCYPGAGARYVRHLDAYKGGSARKVTLLYYANWKWKKDDGGQLRIFTKDSHVDVEPLGDRLLVFQSRLLEHEVLPSNASRYAITMWLY